MKATSKKLEKSYHPSKMVNISEKPIVKRFAEAEGKIWLRLKTIEKIRNRLVEKGDVLSVASVAGILAAKRTWESIPLCHFIPLSEVDVSFSVSNEFITARCQVVGDYKTGVEMEALEGATTALLTIWDMVKYLEKDDAGQYPHTKIGEIRVLRKRKEA